MNLPLHLNVIYDQAQTGAHQMTVDELLFRDRIKNQDHSGILRFYHFSEPTLTVGYGLWKKVESGLMGEIPVIRRITGGGIVSHKKSDLTYAFIIPYTDFISLRKTRGSYLFIHETLKRALLDFGIRTAFFESCCDKENSIKTSRNGDYCFESPVLYDVMLGDQKIAGAGQKRTLGYMLQQGSIAWDLIKRAAPISEFDFCAAFARHLAKALHLTVKETSQLAAV